MKSFIIALGIILILLLLYWVGGLQLGLLTISAGIVTYLCCWEQSHEIVGACEEEKEKKISSPVTSSPPPLVSGGGTEVEAKWLFNSSGKYSKPKLVKALAKLGAKEIHKQLPYRRYAFSLPPHDTRRGYVRTREEYNEKGEKLATITGKFYSESKYADEYEIETTNTLDECKELLNGFGFKQKAYQESFRHKYALPSYPDCTEIAFDELPGLSYVEIDCTNEKTLKEIAKKLGLDWKDAHFGSFGLTYEEVYGLPQDILNNHMPFITFKNAESEFLQHLTKEKDQFKAILTKQRKLT